MQRFELVLAWRHLRAQRTLPGWARVLGWLSLYMLLAGLLLIVVAIYSPVPVDPESPPNAGTYELLFGGVTIALGAVFAALTALLRIFNLLATLIIISVAQGCMALVVVLSLMGGLGNDLEQRIRSHGADIQVQAVDGLEFGDYEELVAALDGDPEIAGVSPYLFGEVMLRSTFNRIGVKLHGIDPARHGRTSGLPESVREGSYTFLEHPEAIAEFVARYAPPSHHINADTRELGAPDRRPVGEGTSEVASPRPSEEMYKQELPPSEEDAWDDESSGAWENAEHEVARMRAEGSLPPRGTASTVAADAWDDSDDSDDPSGEPEPDEWDDASSGEWEDAAEEVADMRAEGSLPPRGTASTTPADGETIPAEPDARGDGAWEDPSREIPQLRASGELPPAPEPSGPDLSKLPAPEVAIREGPEPVRPPVLIGRELAESLGVHTGDPVQVITPVTRITPAGVVPGVLAAQVSGVFYSGVYELDSERVYLPLALTQRLLRSGPKVTAIAIRVNTFEAIDEVRQRVASVLAARGRSDLEARDYRTLNRNLFTAMMLERLAMAIALLFVIVVAAFGILASNLMAVLDRAREIAILKTMGTSSASVTRVFVGEGLLLGLIGSLTGVTAGLVICAVLATTGLPIDEGVFYMERLPVEVHPLEVVAIAAAAVVIVWISSLYPARVAGALAPVEVLRSSEL